MAKAYGIGEVEMCYDEDVRGNGKKIGHYILEIRVACCVSQNLCF